MQIKLQNMFPFEMLLTIFRKMCNYICFGSSFRKWKTTQEITAMTFSELSVVIIRLEALYFRVHWPTWNCEKDFCRKPFPQEVKLTHTHTHKIVDTFLTI